MALVSRLGLAGLFVSKGFGPPVLDESDLAEAAKSLSLSRACGRKPLGLRRFASKGFRPPALDEIRYDRCGHTNFHCPGPTGENPSGSPLRGCCAPLYQDAAPGPGALSASPFVAHRCRSLFFAGSAIATEPGERVNFCWAFGDSVGLRWRFALRLAPTGHGTDYLLSGARASGCSNSWRTKKRMRSTSRFFPGQAVSFPGTSRCPMMEDGVNPGR